MTENDDWPGWAGRVDTEHQERLLTPDETPPGHWHIPRAPDRPAQPAEESAPTPVWNEVAPDNKPIRGWQYFSAPVTAGVALVALVVAALGIAYLTGAKGDGPAGRIGGALALCVAGWMVALLARTYLPGELDAPAEDPRAN